MASSTGTAASPRARTPAGLARKEMILEAAARLFARRGYHGTGMREIGEEAGLLPGSLYAHIRGKEDLLYEIVVTAARQFLAGIETIRASGLPAEERFRRAMRAHVWVIAEYLEESRVFLHEWTALTGPRRAEIRRLRDRYERLWDEIIRELPGSPHPKTARLLVLSAANWTYTWYRPKGGMSPEKAADGFTDLLLRGLGRGSNGSGGQRRGRYPAKGAKR
jgi:AcrR family transcriptional regulator